MPVVKIEHISEHLLFAVWKITEDKEHLLRKLILTEFEKKELEIIHNKTKVLECLGGKAAIQWLVEQLEEKYNGLYKDDCSKRFLIDNDWHISISHSFPYATAVINKKLPVGIDIEKPKEKVLKVRDKFLNEVELKQVGEDIKKASLYWSAKEALYKLYGRKKLVFKDNIRVFQLKTSSEEARIQQSFNKKDEKTLWVPLDLNEQNSFSKEKLRGQVNTKSQIKHYELFTYNFDDHLIVCTGNEIH